MPDTQVSTLETDIEQTRERLAATIDQLVYRASPKTVAKREVAMVKGFFVDGGGSPRVKNIAKVAGGVLGLVAVVVTLRLIVK